MSIKSFSILIADDDIITQKMIQKMFTRKGYQVVSVGDGSEAWEMLQKRYFPIVITDWHMPKMSGIELCNKIRENTFPGYVFTILLTSRDSKADIIEGLEAGADDYLTKPLDYHELTARLKAAERILSLERSLKESNDSLKKAVEEIKLLSITDPLTSAFNRRYMLEYMEVELKRSKRYNHSFSFIMCDLDHFKNINDTYGHEAGDQVLIEFVKSLKEVIRDDLDLVFRYGGEEFAVVLPVTKISEAKILAERLRSHIEKKKIKLKKTTIQVTASFGIYGYEPGMSQDLTIKTIINAADTFMYTAKSRGRNRIEGERDIASSGSEQ
ncbi:MAG: diguanylate cyclase [Calditrichaceae bacterium]